jgi:uncharacterized protein with PQ loop repeat
MQTWTIFIVTTLFAVSGTVSFLAYFPTIVDLWKGKPSANVSSYVLWASTAAAASLYSHVILGDMLAIVAADLQTLACVTILVQRWRLQA